jgi:hypothetical protein
MDVGATAGRRQGGLARRNLERMMRSGDRAGRNGRAQLADGNLVSSLDDGALLPRL